MMQDEKRPLIMELCYNLYKRNQIELRRRSAKNKVHYYSSLKREVVRFKDITKKINNCDRELKSLSRSIGEQDELFRRCIHRRADLEVELDNMPSTYSKWVNKVSELNKRILQHRADYMKARYDAARLTCSNRKRVNRLCKLLGANVEYQFGTAFISHVSFKDSKGIESFDLRINNTEFKTFYNEHEANKAVEKMLNSK
jgi:septal ring factor EnvC (AmiA/AmiB activator)